MNRIKHYIIFGDPIALARARVTRGRFYDAQKHLKLMWGLDLNKQHANEPLFKGPLFLDVIFYMSIPRRSSKKQKELLKDQYHIFKPDSDNLIKFICDVANTICYHDDCLISSLRTEKVYDDGNGPRTEFLLSELNDKRCHRNLK